jgi:hypothetical protein
MRSPVSFNVTTVDTMKKLLNMKKLSEATAIQRRIVKNHARVKKIYDRARPIEAETSALIKELRGICDHPETRDYPWEYDSGYGVQTRMVAQQCVFCGGVCFWGNNNYSFPDEWVDRSN